jgi:hypothetical protein
MIVIKLRLLWLINAVFVTPTKVKQKIPMMLKMTISGEKYTASAFGNSQISAGYLGHKALLVVPQLLNILTFRP